MAGSTRRDLFINIGGSSSDLSNATKAGKSALFDLQSATGSIVDQITENMRKLGNTADAPLAQLESNFKTSLNNIRTELRTLSASGDQGAMLKFFDQNSISAQIAQAERLTTQYRQIAEAAQQVAQTGGENAQAAKVWAASYGTLAAQTELETEKLRDQARAQAEVLGKIDGQIEGGKRITVSAGQQRAAMQQLSFQIGDVAQGFAAGTKPAVIFAQQSGQVIQALQLMVSEGQGWLGTVAKFAPYVGAALVVMSPFIAKLFESGDALQQGIDKLKRNAIETEASRLASEAYSRTIGGQTEAQRKLNDELDRSIRTQRQINQNKLRDSQSSLVTFQGQRPGLLDQITAQEAVVATRRRLLDQPGGNKGTNDPYGLNQSEFDKAEQKLRKLRQDLATLDQNIANTQRGIREAQIPLIGDQISAQFDKGAAAVRQYEIALANLDQRRAIGEGNRALKDVYQPDGTFAKMEVQGITEAEYRRERARIEARKKADEKAASDATKTPPGGTLTDFGSPVSGSVVSSVYGAQRARGPHKGIDYAVPVGTPVYATADGKVARAGLLDPKGYGNLVEIDSGAGTKERFGHLSEIAVKIGEVIAKGTLIGYSGGAKGAPGSGDSTGPHLHYEVLRNGKQVDPTKGRYPTDIVARGDEAERSAQKEAERRAGFERELGDEIAKAVGLSRELAVTEDDRLDVKLATIKAEREARDKALDGLVTTQKLTQAEADQLKAVNARIADEKASIATNKALDKTLDRILESTRAELRDRAAVLNLQGDLAKTAKDRRRIALQLLDLEERERKAVATRLLASHDPDKQAEGQRQLDQIGRERDLRVKRINRDNASPLEEYRDQLKSATDDMNEALEGVAVNGLQTLEDGLLGVINGTETAASAFKKMAASILADLARIAIQKAIVSAIGSVFGFSEGHVGGTGGTAVHGFADGIIRGPGTGTSDSIPAWMAGLGMIRVSNGESIMTAAATQRWAPVLEAMNRNTMPAFADGSVPRFPTLPSSASLGISGANREPIVIHLTATKGETFDVDVLAVSGPHALEVVKASAPTIINAATRNTISTLGRPNL